MMQMDLRVALIAGLIVVTCLALLGLVTILILQVLARRSPAESESRQEPFTVVPLVPRSEIDASALLPVEQAIAVLRADIRRLQELMRPLETYLQDQQEVKHSLAALQEQLTGIGVHIHALSKATAQAVAEETAPRPLAVAAQLDEPQEPPPLESMIRRKRPTSKDEILERYRELLANTELLHISHLVKAIYLGMNGSQQASDFLAPYLHVASTDEQLRAELNAREDHNRRASIRDTFRSLEIALGELRQRHRVPWLIDLLEEAKKCGTSEEKVGELKSLLELEEIQVNPGDDLRDFKGLLSVVDSDGDGSKSVISDVVEIGYRDKKSGKVWKQPKVKVRFTE